MEVIKAINSITAALASQGISKDQKNTFDKYQFRGIDDVYNSLAPLLAEHGLAVVPDIKNVNFEVKTTSGGKPTQHCHVVVSYALYADDGSTVTACVAGEAMDRGDKSLNKAMSSAYKTWAFQQFCIPTEGTGKDSEEESHVTEVQCIGPDEKLEITRLMQETNTDLEPFLDWQQVTDLNLIPLARYENILNALRKKSVRMAEAYATAAQEEAKGAQA